MRIMALLSVKCEWVLVLFDQLYVILVTLVQPLLPPGELGSHLLERINVYALSIGHCGQHVMPLAHLVQHDCLV